MISQLDEYRVKEEAASGWFRLLNAEPIKYETMVELNNEHMGVIYEDPAEHDGSLLDDEGEAYWVACILC